MKTPSWLGHHRVELDECGSTNDEASRLARAGAEHGTIVLAESQTNGRGRLGRSGWSPGGNLYLSVVVRPQLPLAKVSALTLAVGIALCDAVCALGVPGAIKWPNDVVVVDARGTRKLGGILVEAQSQGDKLDAVIVGIGCNLGGEIPSELLGRASTLAAELGRTDAVSREALLTPLLAALEAWIDRFVTGGLAEIAPAWQARMATGIVLRTRIDGHDVTGTAAGLDDDGALWLRDDRGVRHRVIAGDVAVV